MRSLRLHNFLLFYFVKPFSFLFFFRSFNVRSNYGDYEHIRWVFANGQGDWGSIPARVLPKTQKMVRDSSLLNPQHCKVQMNDKWSNPWKGEAPSPTPRCSSYWKGSLRVTLDYSRYIFVRFSWQSPKCRCLHQVNKTLLSCFCRPSLQQWQFL